MMKNNKAFTLVELLVSMAIVAVILGMTVFGIGLAQRASRDAQRRNTVDDVNLSIQSYYELYNEYPEGNDLEFQTDRMVIYRNNSEFIAVELKGITKSSGVNLQGETNSGNTRYCYEWTDGGYVLGAVLESGPWFEAGIDKDTSCEARFGN